jgi:2-polyprenyl-6-methoxyphenol hydroxylase-like FAD-dependent oxidoreductase
MKPYSDVVIVGGGIAGSGLALVLARRGATVTVLERQQDYADRVRGEYMHPWGVAEAQRLGILDTLLSAGGSSPREPWGMMRASLPTFRRHGHAILARSFPAFWVDSASDIRQLAVHSVEPQKLLERCTGVA